MAVTLELFRNERDVEQFAEGETIFREGDRGDSMYAVVDGTVLLKADGRIVETLGPGGVMGEMAPGAARRYSGRRQRLSPRPHPGEALSLYGARDALLRATDHARNGGPHAPIGRPAIAPSMFLASAGDNRGGLRAARELCPEGATVEVFRAIPAAPVVRVPQHGSGGAA
jgi:Cyclic nucleotide-binding domain